MHIIDRRLNPGGKSFANRQRFLRRARAQVRRAVREASSSRSIKTPARAAKYRSPPAACTSRSCIVRARAGCAIICCRATRSTSKATPSRAPRAKAGRARRRAIAAKAKTSFASRCRTRNISTSILKIWSCPTSPSAKSPAPNRCNGARPAIRRRGRRRGSRLPRTLRNSMSRRIALRRPKPEEIEALEAKIAAAEAAGENREAGRACAPNWSARKSAPSSFPTSTRSMCAIGA